MVDKVRRTADRYGMLPKGSSVVVALSGGADSVSLLHCLISLKESYRLTLFAAHLHHGIRGAEAERDEQFCKILCENYHIPLFLRHADIPRLSAERKISEELCGREERYRFFGELAAMHHARIATAHTASDNAETLLFHLTRGMSVTGAVGIPPVRGDIIRPLIDCTREEIEAYCAQHGLDYVTDSTNLSDGYTRNKIRHRVIPVLKELNPQMESAVMRFCESASQVGDYLRTQASALLQQAKTVYGYRAALLSRAHPAVLNEALAQLCREEAQVSAEARHLELLRQILSGGAVELGGVTAVCKQGVLRFAKKSAAFHEKIPLRGPMRFSVDGKTVTVSIQNSKFELNTLVFRCRREGDRFTYPKRGLTKPLRKAMNEQKIPSELRDGLLLLSQGTTVLWCEGLGYSQQGEEFAEYNGLTIEITYP